MHKRSSSVKQYCSSLPDKENAARIGTALNKQAILTANWNPHVHALITDTCRDRNGNCYPMPEISTTDIKGIEKLIAGFVFKMLLKEGMISNKLVENMNSVKDPIE